MNEHFPLFNIPRWLFKDYDVKKSPYEKSHKTRAAGHKNHRKSLNLTAFPHATRRLSKPIKPLVFA